MKTRSNYLFICQDEENPLDISVATKEDIDLKILDIENDRDDLSFKVIGRVSLKNLTIDFNPSIIEWYDKGEKSKKLIDNVVLKIIESL